MEPREPVVLSKILSRTGSWISRRRFLAGLPVVAFGAASCADGSTQQEGQDATGRSGRPQGAINSDSRLDTAIVDGHHAGGSVTPEVERAAEAATYRRFDPALPPLPTERQSQVHWRALEVPIRIMPDLVVAAWTFEGDVPGPVLHVRQGDTVEFTLTNEGAVPHSMDFHAAQIDPKTAFRSVPKGESVTFTFEARNAGAFMYHCGTAPVLMHIGAGMYGAIIVDPPDPLPEAREFVLVQSEYYLGDAAGGVIPFDFTQMASTVPDYVVFNGRPDQYIAEPITVQQGERVRFYVVCAGPNHPCAFHVVGEQFETVYLGAPPFNPLQGVQTFSVAPGGGMVFDLIADVRGEFPFVNHAFGHGQKGAIGFLNVE